MFGHLPDRISKVRCIPLVALVLALSFESLWAASILTNGGFNGSLSSWTDSGTVFNTGDSAVFSDSVATPTAIFQSGALPLDLISMELVFDVFNGVSPSVIGGFLPDSFYATLYLGVAPFGSSLAGGNFDQAVGLFDMDSAGAFNTAAGALFGPSPKGAGWARFTLSQTTAPGFTGPGFATVAFEFYNLNGTGSDSVIAVDNVSLVTTAVVPEPGPLAFLLPAGALLLSRRRRKNQAFS
jgi:hypothetical protein